jgi:murein L,D-transpeptidase YcbB/YkuD
VLVNIPAGELNVFDRTGKRLLPMQVISGKPDKMTPCMATYIQDIVMYPYWNVPQNIALDEMLPRMKKDISYIYNQNLQILDEKNKEVDPETINWDELSTENFPYRVRQASGCENSLGLLKFIWQIPWLFTCTTPTAAICSPAPAITGGVTAVYGYKSLSN